MYGMDYVNAEREQQHAYLRHTVMGHVQRHPQVGSKLYCTAAALQHSLRLLAPAVGQAAVHSSGTIWRRATPPSSPQHSQRLAAPSWHHLPLTLQLLPATCCCSKEAT